MVEYFRLRRHSGAIVWMDRTKGPFSDMPTMPPLCEEYSSPSSSQNCRNLRLLGGSGDAKVVVSIGRFRKLDVVQTYPLEAVQRLMTESGQSVFEVA
jgi:hypothetical protein